MGLISSKMPTLPEGEGTFSNLVVAYALLVMISVQRVFGPELHGSVHYFGRGNLRRGMRCRRRTSRW